PPPGIVPDERYEKYVAVAASLAWHFAGENTDLSFATHEPLATDDVYGLLRYLALVEPQRAKSLLETLEPTNDYNVIFTARARGSIPTALWNCSYFIFFE